MKGIRILALALALACIPAASFPQEPPKEAIRVSVKAKGDDVRSVLASIFEQAKKNYVLPVNFRFALYLSLENQPFDKVLDIVCKQTGLVATLEDGVYQVRVAPKAKPAPVSHSPSGHTTPKAGTSHEEPHKAETGHEASARPEKGAEHAPDTEGHGSEAEFVPVKIASLSKSVLNKRLTTRMGKAELREVFASITDQTKVPIEVASDVPSYRVDAFLIKTSLKYALDNLTRATRLSYRFTDRGTIEVFNPATQPTEKVKVTDH